MRRTLCLYSVGSSGAYTLAQSKQSHLHQVERQLIEACLRRKGMRCCLCKGTNCVTFTIQDHKWTTSLIALFLWEGEEVFASSHSPTYHASETLHSTMGGGYNSSAYLDMDEEFFASLEAANYECHESPIKKATSESTILHKHYTQRRATRTRVVVTLSLMLLAGVGSLALYSSVDATLAMKVRVPSPMFRGSSPSTKTGSDPKVGEVFTGDDSPEFGDAILVFDETTTQAETNYALDDAMLDELDPYDEFHQEGKQIEAN